jgi:thiosulfate/3-mercaptopyruvate sulfurtransferase
LATATPLTGESLVSPAAAEALLLAGAVVAIDSRPASLYAQGHLEGALSLDTKGLYEDTADSELHFPPWADLAVKFGRAGLKRDEPVLVYGDQLMLNREASMLYLYLVLAGHSRVYFLDGGVQNWMAQGLPLETTEHNRPESRYALLARNDLIVDKEGVLDRLGKSGTLLLDTRSYEEFTGRLAGNHIGRAGHLPGAVSKVFSELLNPDGTFKAADQIRALFDEELKADELVLYCRTGPRTSVTGLALMDVLGRHNVKFYTGSMIEWSNLDGYPVVKGP